MKKVLFTLLICAISASVAVAQSRETFEERKELRKMSKNELNSKATKAARKEAKRLKKEGWQPAPGALPLEKQLDRSYLMQMEYDEDMYPKYMMAEAMSIGSNYDAAKMQALELAKQSLAGQIQTEMTSLIENSVANEQLEAGEAVSVTKSIMESKNLISQSIGRVIVVSEVYRTLKNKNKEVLVRVAYNSEMAKKVAKKAAKQSLEKESEEVRNKLDELLGW
ncbi:MAG: hypothetical protein IKJ97_03095 [Bacteroidaceae bacterium]|nr:hypothetical protein [Bacteroidaceae bacterium]